MGLSVGRQVTDGVGEKKNTHLTDIGDRFKSCECECLCQYLQQNPVLFSFCLTFYVLRTPLKVLCDKLLKVQCKYAFDVVALLTTRGQKDNKLL